jgi:hypothetical protein
MIDILNLTACLDPLLSTARGVTEDSNIRGLVTQCTYQLAMLTQPNKALQSEQFNERVLTLGHEVRHK